MEIEINRPDSNELEKWRIYAEQLERYCCFLETSAKEKDAFIEELLAEVRTESPTDEECEAKEDKILVRVVDNRAANKLDDPSLVEIYEYKVAHRVFKAMEWFIDRFEHDMMIFEVDDRGITELDL